MEGKAMSDRDEIDVGFVERLFRLTGSDVAEHGIDYDRGFEGLCSMIPGGDADIVGDRLIGGLLDFFSRLGTRSPGCFLFDEVFLQPFGWETHGGYRIRGGEGERSGS